MTRGRTGGLVIAGWMALGGIVAADTVVMRDGRRVDGRLVAVRDGVVDFEQRTGFFGSRERVRIDRADVRRIELDEESDGDAYDSGRGSTGSRPAGMRERGVSVEAARDWNDTGIDLRAGQTIYVEASGRVRWGPGRQDGPAGEGDSPYNASRPIPGRPGGALIGRIGEGGDYFFIGDERGAIRMRTSGRLYLGVNDDYRNDNSGAFRVTVYY